MTSSQHGRDASGPEMLTPQPAPAPPVRRSKVYRTELTPLSFLRRSAAVFPDKTAVVHADRGTTYSYTELAERINRLASALRAAGLRTGDRVAYLSPNTPALLEAHFAVPAAGGILVAINARLTAAEIAAILQHAGPSILFVDREFASLITALDAPQLGVIDIDDRGLPEDPYEAFLASGSPAMTDAWPEDEEETISLSYTSGTTGRPKGVMYTHRGAYLNALGNVIDTGLTADSVFLWAHMMFHCNGWCFPWAVVAAAGTQVCLRKTEPDVVWDLFATARVTHYHGGPMLHTMIANHPAARRLSRSVTVTIGGAPPSPTLLTRLRELNFRPVHVYGLTETYAPFTVRTVRKEWEILPEAEKARCLAQQGQSRIVADLVRVVDEVMNDVPRDGQTLGEVIMRGNIVAKGYFDDPTATAEAFRGGWFHSGDLAVWFPDGTIELRDRMKDLIICGGENVATIEVEQTLAQHPAVLECAVVAVPDDYWGERPKAFVTLKPGQQVTAAELIAFCQNHLAHFKCPAAVEFGELPKTATGKIQKFVLREQEWAGHEKRIH